MQTIANKRRPLRKARTTKKPSKLGFNPNLLIQKSVEASQEKVIINTKFEDLNLHEEIKANIKKMGFVSPTEIQDKTFEKLIDKANLIGIASTGTGKTGAFLIPILENLMRNRSQKFQTLITVPTRELAIQVYDEFKKLSQNLGLQGLCFIGGTNIEKDIKRLRNDFDILVATPGRLLDLRNRGALKLDKIEVLVLDEFDKMLDMGFYPRYSRNC